MTKYSDSSDVNENSAASKNEQSKKVKLVTIHGTGAGDVTATGDRWWQLGSKFMTELYQRLDLDAGQVEIVPFQWDLGPNSETDRRAAGNRLFKELKSYDESGIDYYVVGHSHGGSVLYSALLQSVNQKGVLERLKCWCTVGTPFLDYRPNKFLFQRLHGFGLTTYATGIFSIILAICVFANLKIYGPEPTLEALQYALLALGVICLAGLFAYERFHRKWITQSERKKVSELYIDRWVGLWHLEDEAISALANIQKVNVPIISSSFLKPLAAAAQLLIVMALGAFLVHDVLVEDADTLLGYLEPSDGEEFVDASDSMPIDEMLTADELITEVEAGDANAMVDVEGEFLEEVIVGNVDSQPAEDLSRASGHLFGLLFYLVILFGFILAITYALKFFAWVLGRPLSSILNKVIWSSVRQRAWGDDVLKEDVRYINSHPPEFVQKFGPLPELVAAPLREHSESNAILTLHKVREILGMTGDSSFAPDLRTELNESLKWQELIHTSYFDVPKFVDLLALTLRQAGLAELKQGAIPTAECEQMSAWCKGETTA